MSLTGLSNLRAAGLRLELSLSAALHNGPLAVDHGQECKIILANKPQEVQKILSPPNTDCNAFVRPFYFLTAGHWIYVLNTLSSGATTSLFYVFKL